MPAGASISHTITLPDAADCAFCVRIRPAWPPPLPSLPACAKRTYATSGVPEQIAILPRPGRVGCGAGAPGGGIGLPELAAAAIALTIAASGSSGLSIRSTVASPVPLTPRTRNTTGLPPELTEYATSEWKTPGENCVQVWPPSSVR